MRRCSVPLGLCCLFTYGLVDAVKYMCRPHVSPYWNLGLYQTWFISGEALHPDLALRFRRRAAPGAQLVNLYGSTEVKISPSGDTNQQ